VGRSSRGQPGGTHAVPGANTASSPSTQGRRAGVECSTSDPCQPINQAEQAADRPQGRLLCLVLPLLVVLQGGAGPLARPPCLVLPLLVVLLGGGRPRSMLYTSGSMGAAPPSSSSAREASCSAWGDAHEEVREQEGWGEGWDAVEQ